MNWFIGSKEIKAIRLSLYKLLILLIYTFIFNFSKKQKLLVSVLVSIFIMLEKWPKYGLFNFILTWKEIVFE